MDLNYYHTLIAVADDCPRTRSTVPTVRGAKKTVAVLQYEMIVAAPHHLTQEDVLFDTWLARQDLPGSLSPEERSDLRVRFFAKPQACLRSSPLPKSYGWGLLFDGQGRVALCPSESPEYQRIITGADGIRILKALRSRRA